MIRSFIAAVIIAAASAMAHATTVLPLDIDQIVDTAAVVFEGTCIGNRVERDPQTNLVVTYTRFAVHDVLKGSAGTTYEIKQVGGDLGPDEKSFHILGVPKFVLGRDYVVFMTAPSRIGLSSPVGLQQGRFEIHSDASGKRVTNGRDFREMTSNIPAAQMPGSIAAQVKSTRAPAKELDLAEFKQLVRSRAERAK